MNGGIYWLASYPKSGNTWFRVFLQNLLENGDQPVDINQLHTGSIASARTWMDSILCFDSADLDHEALDRLRSAVYCWSAMQAEEFGYHKIHDAYTYLSDGQPLIPREATRGVLYMVRNPLDVAVSLAHHQGWALDQTVAILSDTQHRLCGGRRRLYNQIRQQLLSWSAHVRSWLEADLNLMVLRYEDMQQNPLRSFGDATRFLGLLKNPESISKALRFSAIEELQRQENAKHFREAPQQMPRFFRQGQVGGWREVLSSDQIQHIIDDHGPIMQRLGYLDVCGKPLDTRQNLNTVNTSESRENERTATA